MFESVKITPAVESESKKSLFQEIRERVINDKEAILTTRGWNVSRDVGSLVLVTEGVDGLIISFQEGDSRKLMVVGEGGYREITQEELVCDQGLKYKVALDAEEYYYNLLKGNKDKEPTSPPILVLGQFERVGSTWLMDLMDDLGRGHTEPLRQHIALSSCVFTAGKLEEVLSKEDFLTVGEDKPFLANWLKNFIACQYVPETQISKETNMFGGVGFYLDSLPEEAKVIYLKRDIRGVLSSFKKRSLFSRWDYESRFNQVRQGLSDEEGLYKDLFDSCDREDWIDKLVTLYMVNIVETVKYLPEDSKNVKEISYEEGVIDRRRQEEEILYFLRVSKDRQQDLPGEELRMSDPGDVDLDFDTRKVKNDPRDWIQVLSLEEEERIVKKVREKVQLLDTYLEKSDIDRINDSIFFDDDFGVAQGSSLEIVSSKNVELVSSVGTRESIIERHEFINVTAKNDDSFSVGSTLVTNSEYVVFLNEMERLGFPNVVGDNYLFYNEFMHPQRGGRIVKENGIFKIVDGFEDHPANWITWSGATAFAKWLGADLLSDNQWDSVMEVSKDDHESFTNVNHTVSDTTPVRHYSPNTSGFYDLLGNVKVWTREWTWNESNDVVGGVTKNVKGVAWNSSDSNLEGSYKPFLMSARSLGVRLSKDVTTVEYSEDRFVKLMNCFYKECTTVDDKNIGSRLA